MDLKLLVFGSQSLMKNKLVIPEWFDIGAKIWFMGFGLETSILSIDEVQESWIGLDADGQHLYPLDEVLKHWRPLYTGPDDGLGVRAYPTRLKIKSEN